VGPLYQQAFKEAEAAGSTVDLSPVISFVNSELKGLVSDDPAAVALNKFLSRLKGDKVAAGKIIDVAGQPLTKASTKPLTLQQLQSAKRTTDLAIDKMGSGGKTTAAQNNAKRLLSEAERLYVDQLGKISPTFSNANKEWSKHSDKITALENTVIGRVAKVADDKLHQVSRELFRGGDTNSEVIEQTRRVIESTNPEAWSSIMRIEAQRRLSKVALEGTKLTPDNIPNKLVRALFKTGEEEKLFFAGMTKDQRTSAMYLKKALERAGLGRPGGSQTGVRGVIKERLDGAGLAIRRFFKNPVERLVSTGEESAFNRNVSSLADVIFDPKWSPRLKELRKFNPNSPAAARAMTQLLNDIESSQEESK
jgi:hypothetical protein